VRRPVLIAYDGSSGSRRAIERAGELLPGRRAVVLHLWQSWVAIAPVTVPVINGAVIGMARELDELADTQSEDVAADGAHLAAEAGFSAEALSRRSDGPLWRDLLDAAEELDASVIVVGSRGMSGISAALGSVSSGVVHHAHVPVLVVPPE
jgi:nucleotide-binding universal stress UspA family protein